MLVRDAGAGWGLIQGKRVAGKLLENLWQTVGKTAVERLVNRWKTLENCRKMTGKTAGKPLENRWKTVGKPLVKLLENRRRTAGKLPAKPLENSRQNRLKTARKPPENRREKPRFWVTFASLNKGLEGPGRASPASFFGPWGGLP